VTVHDEHLREAVLVSHAGVPVGDCPTCEGYEDGVLVNARGSVHCTGCGADYGLSSGATVLESTCEDCGLPCIRARRGKTFEVCLNRSCESLTDAVTAAFDRAWDCPDCGDDLRVLNRGHLLAGCASYPDCEAAFSIPDGLAVGSCACGLPTFETRGGKRCLDRSCERFGAPTDSPASSGG
jgi:DNA topoisomerase-1